MPNSSRRRERNDRPRLLIAIGGNAIHPGRGPGTVEEQRDYAARTGRALLPVMSADNELVITHGNGPVVGKILMRQVLSRDRVPPMSMDVCVAHSQGGIAYLLMQSLENTLREAGNDRHVVCLLTQVEVDPDDPAFENPTKPIGFFYEEAEAKVIAKRPRLDDARRRGARMALRGAVATAEAYRRYLAHRDRREEWAVVIAGGGGGDPRGSRRERARRGVEGVIDKDLSSAHMAQVLGIREFMILTSVDKVQIGFGTPRARSLDEVHIDDVGTISKPASLPKGAWGPRSRPRSRFNRRRRAACSHRPPRRGRSRTRGRGGDADFSLTWRSRNSPFRISTPFTRPVSASKGFAEMASFREDRISAGMTGVTPRVFYCHSRESGNDAIDMAVVDAPTVISAEAESGISEQLLVVRHKTPRAG